MTGLDVVFMHPERLWAIVPAVLIICLLLWWHFLGVQKALRENAFLRLHIQEAMPRPKQYAAYGTAIATLLSLLVAVWAEPEKRISVKDPVYAGVCQIFMIDVSASMKYAHDVDPYADRLTAAKAVLADLVQLASSDEDLRGSYWRALIPFAGSAVTYMSLSSSEEEFLEAIDAIDETVIDRPGTDLLTPFLQYEALTKDRPREARCDVDLVILVSDGGKGEGNRSDLPAIKMILKRLPHAVVYTVGIGSVEITKRPDGVETRKSIPVPLIKRDRTGAFVGYAFQDAKEPKSHVYYSELDETILIEVAGKDHYVLYKDRERFLDDFKKIVIEHRQTVKTKTHEHRTSIALWFLIPAFCIAFFLFRYAKRFWSFWYRKQ